ncbi:MAG: class I SAM-dependent methyltransferase [Acidimicrobiales bacterium]
MPGTSVSHPLFARFFARFAPAAECLGSAAHRDELLEGLGGKVIEVGAGSGLNFAHYPKSVTEVVAVEPEPYLRARATEAARQVSVPVRVVEGTADMLPVEDGYFDVAVASLVLCSVPDQAAALAECSRVLRSGGELRFYEHVLAEEPSLARFQRRVDLVWPRFGGGCHASRDTLRAIERAGFQVSSYRRFSFRPCMLAAPVSPHVIGRATRP